MSNAFFTKVWMVLKVIFWILLGTGACVLAGFADTEQGYTACKEVKISIDYGNADTLVTVQDITDLIKRGAGNIIGKYVSSINTSKIEAGIRKNPYVSSVTVYEDLKGRVYIHIRQREPILRVINRNSASYYLDGQGYLLPLNPNFTAHVIVATGAIADTFSRAAYHGLDARRTEQADASHSVLEDLYLMSLYITGDPFFNALVDQIHVNPNGEMEIYPRVGNHIILFGKAENIQEKFRKLFIFYQKGLNIVGWNKYNVINIKFRNQVICSKI